MPSLQRQTARPARRRTQRRGVTRLEALLGGGFVALAIAVVSWFSGATGSKQADAEAEARAQKVLQAVRTWQADNGVGCPTLSQLEYDGVIDERADVDDPWGDNFRVRCDGGQVQVESAGPDGERGTDDDVRVGS